MVETARLKIIPLTHRQLTLYLRVNYLLEDELGLARTGRTISEDVKEVVKIFTLPQMKKSKGKNYLFYTFWIVIDKLSNSIVAELGFKGEPNYKGEVEIGYGTMPGHQGKGYMTEAVSGMIEWAKQREDIHCILAETDKNNHASIRIVQKNGFLQYDQKLEMLWWRKRLSEPGSTGSAG